MQRVLITGASSGIGMATALDFAKQGAALMLLSRNQEKLEEVAAQCRGLGAASAGILVCDVTDADEVELCTASAVEAMGAIDVWVNNAGIGTVGAMAETPLKSQMQVVRTNLMGYMHGAYCAVRQFKKQGHGTLINLNSLGAWIPIPYASSYSASKFGLLGFMEALRAEMQSEKKIHICDIMPSFVDTPGFTHGANYSGTALKPMPPLTAPETVARHVLRCARNPRRRDTIGLPVVLARSAYFLFPRLTMRIMKGFLDLSFRKGAKAPRTDGAIFQSPREYARVSGGNRVGNGPRIAGLLALGAGLYLLGRKLQSRQERGKIAAAA